MKYTLKHIGQLIREAREYSGMSIIELSNTIKENESDLSKIEKGELNIPLDRFLNIINVIPIYIKKDRYLLKKRKPRTNVLDFTKKLDSLEIYEKLDFNEEIFKITKSTAMLQKCNLKQKTGKSFSMKSIGDKTIIIRIK